MSFFSKDSDEGQPVDLSASEQTSEMPTTDEQAEPIGEQTDVADSTQDEETQDDAELYDPSDSAQYENEDDQDADDQDDYEQDTDEDQEDEQFTSSDEPNAKLREWQSKYDKLNAEYENYKKQTGEIPNDVIQLAADIQNNPKVLDAIEAAITGKSFGAPPAANSPEAIQQQISSLQRPTPPEKPSDPDDYVQAEQYKKAQQQYLQDRLDYLEQKDELQSQLDAALQQQTQQAQQAEKQKQELSTQLRSKFGFTESDVKGFMQMFNEQPTIGDLVQLYRFKKNPKPATPSSQDSKARRRVPKPAVGSGGTRPAGKPRKGGFFSQTPKKNGLT